MRYYYLYQIRNKNNGMIYIGVHCSNKIRDRYMGSGTRIKEVIKKEGIENFEKSILEFFENKEDMLQREKEVVNKDFIKRNDTYNLIIGGGKLNALGNVNVKDKNGNTFMVSKDDPRYLSGELVGCTSGQFTVKDKANKCYNITKDDPRYLSAELIPIAKNKVIVKDSFNNIFQISKDDPRYLSGELVGWSKGNIVIKDNNGKKFMVSKDDPRYLSGELTHQNKGLNHTKKSKYKMAMSKIGKFKNINNLPKSRIFIHNIKNKINKKIKPAELEYYLSIGWKKGKNKYM